MTESPRTRRQAAALRYVPGEMAVPEVVASGEGTLAERIIVAAREHGIPIHENRDLVALLAKLPPETAIPVELYRAVAEVIAFLVRTSQGAGVR